jgi:hypothetical protein
MTSAARAIRAEQIGTDNARKEARVQLVARVQVAYEHLRDAMRLRGSARCAAVENARSRLDALNRALAMLAMQAT